MRTCLFMVLVWMGHWAAAQGSYNFFPLSLDRGLSDTRVTAIVQDQYGFMWFATPNGLNRSDAYTIKKFYADTSKTGLTSNHIISLFSDHTGGLWIGTSNGLLRYNFAKENFEHFSSSLPISTAWVNCITEDNYGNIYAGTREGLFNWNRRSGQWNNVSAEHNLANRFVSIRGLLFFDAQTLFATTENKGFYRIDTRRKTLETIPYKTEFADTCCLFTIGMQKMNDSMMLIGALSMGLQKFNVKTNRFSTTQGVLRKNDSILFNTTYQVLKDHTGRFWTANNYFGIAEYDPRSNMVLSVPPSPDNPYGFEGNTATCIYEDKQFNIWVGTASKGVYRFNPNQHHIRFYSQNNYTPGALQKGHVTAIASLGNNGLMIGMDAGPAFFDRSRNYFTNYRGYAKEFGNKPLEQVQCGIMDRKGIAWMGTNRLGLMRYDTVAKTFRTFSRLSKDTLKEDGITRILEMDGDSLLLIGWNRIASFNTGTFKNNSYRRASHPLYDILNVADLCYDNSGKLVWVATTDGKLYQYDPVAKTVADKSGLLVPVAVQLRINNISVDPKNRLWCATTVGAICLENGKHPKIYRFDQSINTSAEIKNILPAGDDIWLTNNRTLARLSTTTGRIVYLGERDGLGNVQLFGNSLSLSAWNTVIIGSNKGFYEIFPDRLLNTANTSPAHITSFQVYDKPFMTDTVISAVKSIRLRHDQNFFSFTISAFDFTEANDLEYAYKLEGFDTEWQYTGKKRSGGYTNVPGGVYTLLVKSRNTSGQWNESGQSIQVIIARPFWQTWWFGLLAIAVISTIIFFLYRRRIKIIKKRALMRTEYEIKLNELENSALRTQMSPHFIFNSLNTINSFINRNEGVKANQYISKFSRLIRTILDHSREKKILLQDELEVLELYIQIERIRFDNKFDYSISIDPAVDETMLEIPPLIIQPFVENAILHGLLPLDNGGLLQIVLSKENDLLLCKVDDNGVGRSVSGRQKALSPVARKSHGIEITMKRIELFNKEHRLDAKVEVIDKVQADGSSAGTLVKIPLAWEDSF